MDISIKGDAFTASVTIYSVLEREDRHTGFMRKKAAFGTRVDTGEEVFVNGKTATACNLEEGETYNMRMVVNDKYLSGESTAKFFAFYCFKPRSEQAPPDSIYQLDLEDGIQQAEDEDRIRKRRKAERKRCDELLSLGGVWTAIKMTSAIMRKQFTSTSDMNEEEAKICGVIGEYMWKRHEDGNLARVEIRKHGHQQRASYIFYTTKPEKLAEALRNA